MYRPLTVLLIAALLAWGAAIPAPAGESITVREVLDRFVEAVGGPDCFADLDLRHYRGTIVQDLSWKDPKHEERPFLAEADVQGQVRYAEVDAWSDLPTAGDTDLRTKLRWVMHPHFALVVEDYFPDLSVSGREVRAGRPVVVLAPRDLAYEYYALYFDEESGLLAHIGYHNDLEDWCETDGVLYPHRWVFGRKGGHTTYVFEEVGSGPGR